METIREESKQKPRLGPRQTVVGWFATSLGRILVSVFVPFVTFIVLWQGFMFLRDAKVSQITLVVVAIIWGVGGVALLYTVSNFVVEQFSKEWTRRLQPCVFVGPALAILAWVLAIPTLRTLYLSFMDANSFNFVGLSNYVYAFTDRIMLEAFRNNLLWMIFGTSLSVGFGLLIAVLADRSRFEGLAKSLIFVPYAISMVGAGVIWNMIYNVNPNIGILNSIFTTLTGHAPVAWTASAQLQPWNNLFLIVISIWLQTGYAMVLFSAALKGIPTDIIEAGRVDGANEVQVFFQIMIPSIMSTIIAVSTTIVIFTLKIFDVVWVMTGGQFSTQVIATQFYREYFTAQNSGYGSAIAIVLLICVIPVMIYNLRGFSGREAFK